ncbi:MAG: hypothetical protein KAU28_10420, partial [Phycisphaerae bacterium]|nr:hypothetical protein [Phycisphaerae bacterium]
GRHYYWGVLKRAFFFGRRHNVETYAVWACRILLFAVAGIVAILMSLGLELPFAILFILLVLLMFMVMARINAESGLIFCHPYWQPLAVFIGLFGASAMGANTFIIIALLCVVLTIDPRECLMPFMVNGLKFCDDTNVKPAKAGWTSATALLLALAVAVPIVLWANYNFGSPLHDIWATKSVPKMPFDALVRAKSEMDASGSLQHPQSTGTLGQLAEMNLSGDFLWWAGAGLALALGFSVCRLRFTWWPLHPILFLVWGTHPMRMCAASFLLGWIIKNLITKFGGWKAYDRTRLLMIGIIAGDLLGGLAFMAAGAVYYAVTGIIPPAYYLFPG